MKPLLRAFSYLALLSIVAAPVAVPAGWLSTEGMKGILLAATLAWFGATPFWMKGDSGGLPAAREIF